MQLLRLAVLVFAVASTPMMPAHAASAQSETASDAAAPLAAPPVTPAPGAPRPEKTLTGAEAWNALVGNTVSGKTPDGPYKEYYNPDGTVIHVDRDGKDVGHWTFKQSSICFTDPDDGEDCRNLQVAGNHGAFVDPDGSSYRFDILPGNPENF